MADEWDPAMDTLHDPPLLVGRSLEPLTLRQWSDHFEDTAYKTLSREEFGHLVVMAVWTGMVDDPFHAAILQKGADGHLRLVEERCAYSEAEALQVAAELAAKVSQ